MARRRERTQPKAAVSLLSANPLALPELMRLTERLHGRLAIKSRHLRLTLDSVGQHEIVVPNATVYVIDAFSTGLHTEAVIGALRARHPNARVIVLVPRIQKDHFSLLQLGVKGIVAFPNAARMLPRAIATVAGGGIWMPRTLIARFLDRMLRPSTHGVAASSQRKLSRREREVLDLVLKNQSNKEISSNLHIAESTVKFHLAQLFQKFGVRRRADLILQSIQQPPL